VGWEQRGKSGNRYYYRSVRREGRPVKLYVGAGIAAKLAEDIDAGRRRQREAEECALLEEIQRTSEPRSLMIRLEEITRLLMEGTLLAAGFHRPNFGPWRRRRGH
jgi:hypothetical protein